jgi:hypothetical protein
LSEFLDLQDPRNLILRRSLVYQIRDRSNAIKKFLGVLIIPAHQVRKICTYFQSCEKQGLIHIHELTPVLNIRISISLYLYQSKKGWRDTTLKEINNLTQQLRNFKKNSEIQPSRASSESTLYVTRLFNRNWNYLDHPQVHHAISLYCKAREFNYMKFPFDRENNDFTIQDRNLLKWFYYNNVLQVSWELNRLINDFSMDYYIIRLPKLPFEHLSLFLKFVPFSQIFFTDNFIYLLTLLNKNQLHWIKNLEWMVMPIIAYHFPTKIDLTWFDSELKRWKIPYILTK